MKAGYRRAKGEQRTVRSLVPYTAPSVLRLHFSPGGQQFCRAKLTRPPIRASVMPQYPSFLALGTLCLPGSRASVSSPGKWGRRQNDSQLQQSVTLNLHPPCPHLSVSLCYPHPNLLVRIPGSIRPLATATRSLPITASGSRLENALSVASAASMAPNQADRHPVRNTQRQSGPHTPATKHHLWHLMAEKGSAVDIISLSVPSIPVTQGGQAVVAPILDFMPYFIDCFFNSGSQRG